MRNGDAMTEILRILSSKLRVALMALIFCQRGKSDLHSEQSFPKCLVLNSRSLRNKVLDLQALLLVDIFDVVAITETWQTLSIFKKHSLYKRGRGGGGYYSRAPSLKHN